VASPLADADAPSDDEANAPPAGDLPQTMSVAGVPRGAVRGGGADAGFEAEAEAGVEAEAGAGMA